MRSATNGLTRSRLGSAAILTQMAADHGNATACSGEMRAGGSGALRPARYPASRWVACIPAHHQLPETQRKRSPQGFTVLTHADGP